jgi:hypothetical protein
MRQQHPQRFQGDTGFKKRQNSQKLEVKITPRKERFIVHIG